MRPLSRLARDSRPSRHAAVLAALVCGLLLRLLFVVRFSNVSGDSLIYGMFARNLIEHGVYGFSVNNHGITGVAPTLIRLPGYPLFLALCFLIFGIDQYQAVLLVQALVDLGTCLLIASLAGQMFGRRAFIAALWMSALCPFLAGYVAQPLTETLTLFTIALAFYALACWKTGVEADGAGINRWLFVLAFALAYSIQLRPEQGLLAAAVVPAVAWVMWRRQPSSAFSSRALQTIFPVALLSLLTLLPLAPWAIRNWDDFHVFEPLAPREASDPGELVPYGFQRWYRTWAIDFASTELTYWPYDGSPVYLRDLPARAFDSEAQYAETAKLIADYNQDQTPTTALDQRFDRIARERIAADPMRYYVALPAARVLNMLFRPRVDTLPVPLEWWRFREHPSATLFACFYGLLNLAYFAAAAYTLLRRHWNRLLGAAMLATLAFRTLLLLTIDNSEPRYTLEFFPVLIVLGAACWMPQRATYTRRP